MIDRVASRDRPFYLLDLETPSRPTLTSALVPDTCVAGGAVLVERDGHTVAAHYGSVPGEIAVCMKSVGLADRSDLGALEVRGDQNVLDRALSARLGDPPPAPGTARRMGSVWYMRVDQRRVLLVGSHPALASAPPIGRGRDRSDLPHTELGAAVAIVSLIGPRASQLVAAAGLPGGLAVGAVARDASDAAVLAILRESRRDFLVLVRAAAADALWTRLLAAGEPLGASFVGCDALALLGASAASGG